MNPDLSDLELTRRPEILVGHDPTTRQPHHVSLSDLTQTSVHIVGASGYGKSFFLRSLIDQFVRQRQAFGVIDPASEIAEYALWRLRIAGVDPSRIVPLNPGNQTHATGFNPLTAGGADPAELASFVLDAFLKAWGAKDFDSTPRLEGVLGGVFRLLVEGQLTLIEAPEVLAIDNVSLRETLRDRVSDRMVRQDWAEFEKLARREKLALFESSRNRLRRVLRSKAIQAMLGQTKNTLNLRDVMDSGKFLLADLGGANAPETQRLLGALLMNGLSHAAKQRDSRRRRPWFLICDEFGEFATPDFARSLDAHRKRGLHLVLAHQRLRQLERDDPDTASAVMTNAKIKVVFGGLERIEAERMARELFTGQVTGARVKHIANQTKFRPVFGTFVVETVSTSDTQSDSESWTESDSESSGETESESSSQRVDGGDSIDTSAPYTAQRGQAKQSSRSTSASAGGSSSIAHTTGRSRSVVPVTRHQEFIEETGRQFQSVEEEWEAHVAVLHGLPKRHALIRVYAGPVIHVTTPHVEPERLDQRWNRYHTKVIEKCPHVRSVAAVAAQIEQRRRSMANIVELHESKGRPFEVKSFRE